MLLHMLTHQVIFQKVLEYLAGGSFHTLEEWILLNLRDILDSGAEVEKALAKLIEGSAIEIGEGILSESQFKGELQSFVDAHRDSFPDTWLGTSNISVDMELSVANRTETWNFLVGSSASPALG